MIINSYLKEYSISRYIRIFIICLATVLTLLCSGVIISASEISVEKYEKYLISNAKAYWNKGVMIQYDDPEKYDEGIYFSPEEATEDHTMYSNCGAFMSALYMETFGIELPWRTENLEPYARENEDSPYIVTSISQMDYTELIYENELVPTIASKIRLGDMLLFRFNTENSKGHVVMVYKLIYDDYGNVVDAWVIHSTGTKDIFESHKSKFKKGFMEGTVRITRMSKLVNGFYSKMVDDVSYVYFFSIIRPLATPGEWLDIKGRTIEYTVTETTKQRYKEKGDYHPAKKLNIRDCYITPASDMIYTGENAVPLIQVRTSEDGDVLQEGKDYIIAYLKDDNVYRGEAFITVHGIGDYCGSIPVYFNIL